MSDQDLNLLTTSNLSIGYASKKVTNVIAEDLNLKLSAGNLTCLLGKNGIGKSTLLRTLHKVQHPLEGEIFIGNEPLEQLNSIDLAKKMSAVFTERIPNNNLSVYELIALGRQPYTNWLGNTSTEDKHFIDLAIAQTHVEDLLAKKHYELSDGQLQKVMIARALAQNTPIMILDEPTAHLDIHAKMELFLMLKKMAKTLNKAILVSTHEIHHALQLADELWLMDTQKITCGKTQDVIESNALEKLFGSALIQFDVKLRQFVFNQV